jgi:branched-chain amino acid transport system ATP-binding protein
MTGPVAPPGGTGAPLLACHALECGYGSVNVVRSFDLSAHAGHVIAILGPNGAGKTTLLETMAGLLEPQAGRIEVDGNEVRGGRPTTASRAGIVLVPDDRALFNGLSVRDNLRVAQRRSGRSVEEMLELFPALRVRLNVDAAQLSGGEQQMLALARALVQRPRILLIDEMSMGLAPVIVESLLPMVRRIADEQNTLVVMVEQHVGLALEIADEAMVMVHGEVHLRGSASDLLEDPQRLEQVYLGSVGQP